MKPLLLSLITSIILPFLADAMPTVEEQEKVRPLVQGLMKPDLDAMKQGKKSRSDVAKSAMDLYAKADSPAAKMLLARNALNLYAKAGEYEAAESALNALLAAVPDYPAPDLAELLEKTLHPIPLRAAPNLRARLAAIRDKAQAASQLKKLLPVYESLAEGPKRKACAARIASAYVALDDWPNAIKYFAVSDSPAAAAASAELKLQDEPEASRPYDKPADVWWEVELPKKDAKLAAALRAHSAALYAKAIPTLSGLSKVQAERRIQEVNKAVAESASAKSDSASSAAIPPAGSAKFTGVKLVGSTVKNTNGVLSDFSNGSYALIEPPIPVDKVPVEVVVEFSTPPDMKPTFGIMGGQGQGFGFSPFCINDLKVTGCFSSNGKSWDIAQGYDSGVILTPSETYRLKCIWDGSAYTWYVWRNKWVAQKTLKSKKAISNGLKLQLGTNRGLNHPFNGSIDLTKCYIKAGGKLWWEGARGAYVTANQ